MLWIERRDSEKRNTGAEIRFHQTKLEHVICEAIKNLFKDIQMVVQNMVTRVI